MEKIILASASPRRKELLELLNIPFSIVVSDVDESVDDHLTPKEVVMELSRRKARAVYEKVNEGIVIGSDTIVVVEGEILNKPKDAIDARRMLKKLSGQTHSVFTGVTLINKDKEHSFYEETLVTFWELSEEDITSYIETKPSDKTSSGIAKSSNWRDKAGAYGIQEAFGMVSIKSITGDYNTVVGLPIARLKQELRQFTTK